MKKRRYLKYVIIGCVIGIPVFLVGIADQFQPGQSNEMKSLTLKDYPELFSKHVIIVIGENVTEVQRESVVLIKENLKNLTGNEPIIKKEAEVSETDKASYNLILVGTSESNILLKEVYEITNATKVTKEYPGENKGILEILTNPWNRNMTLLIIAGSDKRGVEIAEDNLLASTTIELKKGSLMIVCNNTEMTEVIELTKRYMLSNNIKVSTLKTAKKISFTLEGPAKAILLKSFPILSQYLNSRVWEMRWQGEVEELEYVVIVDPESRDIVCGWGINRLAAPGIIPLKGEMKTGN